MKTLQGKKVLDLALLVADKAHENQSYGIYPYRIYPYRYHLRAVVSVAEEFGFEKSVVVACALHDVLEDTPLTYNNLKGLFGVEVAEIVYCVTDELGRNRKERKAKTYPKIKSNPKAIAVKLCDRIANVRHCKEHNSYNLLDMYEREQGFFYKNLFAKNQSAELDKAWKMLNELF